MDLEQQTTPDLDTALMEGLDVFDGAPVDAAEGEPAATVASSPAAEKTTPEPGQAPTVATPLQGTAAERTPGGPAATPSARFKSHDEAEEGYRHLQREKTAAEARAKVLEAELLQIKNAERRREDETREDEEFLDFATQRHLQALADIDALDPDAPDYRKQVAACWAKSQRDIRRWQGAGAPSGTERQAPGEPETTRGAQPQAQTGQAPGAAGLPPDGDDGVARVRAYANEFIVREGLPENDPLFWVFAANAPTNDDKGQPLPLDDQIRWAMGQTRNYHASILAANRQHQETEAAARAREAAERSMPLGRSGAAPPAPSGEPERPLSLSDALDSAMEQRRL